jgi:hypothetical protein
VPKGGQRAEGGEEARVMMRVHEQGWNCWRNTLRCVLQNGLKRNLRVWQTLKGTQRDEGGEEARVMTCVPGQDPSDGGKTGGNAQSRNFEHPEDA